MLPYFTIGLQNNLNKEKRENEALRKEIEQIKKSSAGSKIRIQQLEEHNQKLQDMNIDLTKDKVLADTIRNALVHEKALQ